jgi:LCP family protein required for cell wall assembly
MAQYTNFQREGSPGFDPLADTRPTPVLRPKRRRRSTAVFFGLLLGALLGLYLFLLPRSNILVLGIDRAPDGTALGRTDTIILTTVVPLKPQVAALSIPRDLWVTVPGYGENRINTAHFFGENAESGTGPELAMQTVEMNFGVDVDHYVRVQFEGFQSFIDALGGIEIELEEPLGGYPAGTHLLNGEEALAFVRDRAGTDDFFRMRQGQIFLKSLLSKVSKPQSWGKLPKALVRLGEVIDTNVPLWKIPSLGVALLRAGSGGVEFRTIDRSMVQGFTTASGAQVLGPNWSLINPLLLEIFEQ